MDLYQEIVALKRARRKAALATIVKRIGSTPRKDHAKMLIRDDGSSLGSVGGGCVEAEVWQKAREVMQSGRAALLHYEMKEEDARDEGLVCGGTVEIFIEPILPDPSLILMGAGHVAQAIARVAAPLGFQISVLDDRESFASPERFPDAGQLVVSDFSSGLQQMDVHENSFILVVTRGHSHDQIALEQAIIQPARYVGLVGSRRKIQLLVRTLLESGIPSRHFEKLYAPIGLPIGSETPQEIAVSVVAELIALQKGVHRRSSKQEFVMNLIHEVPENTAG